VFQRLQKAEEILEGVSGNELDLVPVSSNDLNDYEGG